LSCTGSRTARQCTGLARTARRVDVVHSESGRSFAESLRADGSASATALAVIVDTGKRLGGLAVVTPAEQHAAGDRPGALLHLVHSTSAAPAARRARVRGGAEEPPLARRVRLSERRRHDAYASSTPTADAQGEAGGSRFACERSCARPRERRAVGDRPVRRRRLRLAGRRKRSRCRARTGGRQRHSSAERTGVLALRSSASWRRLAIRSGSALATTHDANTPPTRSAVALHTGRGEVAAELDVLG
jgi:hypothetical protein